MKTILKTLLFMAVLCLTGCSGEDSQVTFSVHEINSPNDAQTYTVAVSANCPWLISDDRNRTYTDIRTGEGDAEVRITVYCNATTEDQTYRVIIRSRDGSCSDELVINQEAWRETHAGNISTLPAEGCEFSIDILTNDNVKEMDLPEWISFVSSRALTEHVYMFKAEPNKTGAERSGTITLYGEDSYTGTIVKQKPYYPTGIDIEEIKDVLLASGETYTFPFKPIPEYACTSELKVSTSVKSAHIENGYIHILCDEPRTHTLEILQDGKCIYSKEFVCISPEISLNISNGAEYCIATPFEINTDIPQEYAEISFSDDSVIEKVKDKYMFTKEGTVEILARNTLSGKEAKVSVSGSYITFSDISSSLIQIDGYIMISYGTVIKMYDVESYVIYSTIKGNGEKYVIKEGTGNGSGKFTTVDYAANAKGYFNQEDVWIHVEAIMTNGEKKSKSMHL